MLTSQQKKIVVKEIENSVIIYTLSYISKPIRLEFSFETQIRIFQWNLGDFSLNFDANVHKYIVNVIHMNHVLIQVFWRHMIALYDCLYSHINIDQHI